MYNPAFDEPMIYNDLLYKFESFILGRDYYMDIINFEFDETYSMLNSSQCCDVHINLDKYLLKTKCIDIFGI